MIQLTLEASLQERTREKIELKTSVPGIAQSDERKMIDTRRRKVIENCS